MNMISGVPFSVCRCALPQKNQRGLTIIELMVSLALGLLVVLAATALLLSTKSAYSMEDDLTHINDTGRFVTETVTRSVRQSGYRNWDADDGPMPTSADVAASIRGLDARSLKANTNDLDVPLSSAVHGSDVLAVRFFGSGSGKGDGTTVNCAGFSVGAPASGTTTEDLRGWSIFYVGADASGEPELRCKYEGNSGWTADAIARGVESFQVLYGIDTDGDGIPNQLVNASAIDAMDDAQDAIKSSGATSALATKQPSNWSKVALVKVALLVRGAQNVRGDALTGRYDLFGSAYSDAQAARDPGTTIKDGELSTAVRGRLRKVFSFSIPVRQSNTGGAS